jgi:hypothetical protein
MMQINKGGGKKTIVPDPYNIRGTLLKLVDCMVSMDDESSNAKKNRSRIPSVNDLGLGMV